MSIITKWSVSDNTPGFHNDDAPSHYDTYEEARAALVDEMSSFADYLDERPEGDTGDLLRSLDVEPEESDFKSLVAAMKRDDIDSQPMGASLTFTLDGRDHGFGSDYRAFTLQPVTYTGVFVMAWSVKPTYEGDTYGVESGYDFWFTSEELVIRFPNLLDDLHVYDYHVFAVEIEGEIDVHHGAVVHESDRQRVVSEIVDYMQEIHLAV